MLDSSKSRSLDNACDCASAAAASSRAPVSFFDRFRGLFKSDSQNRREREAATVKRPGNYGDLGDADREVCAKAGLSKPAVSALDRFIKRRAGGGELSNDDNACLRAAGFDTNNPDAVLAVARFFQRGAGAGTLSEDEASKLEAMGVDGAQSAATLARVFKRPGGFRGSGDDARDLAAAGIDAGDGDKIAVLQRVFRRPCGFGILSDDEAARLAMAGVDVTDPAAARVMACMFKRGLGSSDSSKLSDDEASQLRAMCMTDPSVASALARAFKRAGGFSGMAGDGERGLAVPGIDAGNAEKMAARSECSAVQVPLATSATMRPHALRWPAST
ncbi:hypothetical protein FOA52_001831 [Chlamydomonas sp. UWO 241]|nr:hypothetical protein FOA52_001831 [Chlamydomonas sp. UWO 241]